MINTDNNDYKIVSIGHRNPQGLYFDQENNFLLETEHGPKGGDEINIIKIENISNNSYKNYGWPISSVGEHYKKTPEKLKKYPLYNSHSEHGFIEPKKTFVPSIAISEITKIGKKKYVTSSLKDKSIYFFDLDSQNNIINFERVFVDERVRDIKFKDEKLYLFLENTPSIGIISLN